MEFVIQIFSSGLVAALAAAYFTHYMQKKAIEKNFKYNIICNFCKYRNKLDSEGFLSAINSIYLTFSDDDNVVCAVDDLHNSIVNNESQTSITNKLYNVYRYMSNNIKIDPIDEKRFCDRIFNDKHSS